MENPKVSSNLLEGFDKGTHCLLFSSCYVQKVYMVLYKKLQEWGILKDYPFAEDVLN